MRMKLHKSTANGDYEVYPIYEIDYQYLSNLGITIDETSDSLSNHNFKGRRITCINSNLRNGISTNIPLLETENGNIIPFWHRFRTQNNNIWYLDEENRASYSAIEQGVRPPDWGVNPNYIWLQTDYFEASGTKYFNYPRPVNISDSFSSSKSYYEDTKRTELKMFYTDTGCSFSVFKCSISKGAQNTLYARQYGAFGFPNYPSSTTIRPHYNMTTPENNGFGESFASKIEVGITSQYNVLSYWHSFDSFQNGCNCPMFFVHYNDNGTDFYGVAIVQMSSFTGEKDTCFPIAIRFTVLDATFWGTSIISGGESGAGSWGNNNIPAGGGGTFSFTSDNRGDSSGTAIAAEMTKRIHGFNTAAGGLYNIHVLTDSEMRDVMNALYYNKSTTTQVLPDFIERCKNSVYNPLSAFLAINAIPHNLIMRKTTTSILTAAGFNISESINHVTPPTYAECEQVSYLHLGSYDFNANHVFDAFPDFAPYTKIKLHLPYIGVIDIDTNAVMYGSIAVTYFCDAISGNLTAFVWCSDKDGNSTYKYTASGNCAYSYPLFALAQDGSAIGKLIGSGLNLAGGMLTGSANMLASGAGGIADGLLSAQFGRRETQSAGAFGGNVSILGDSVCYLEIIRPVWINPENYQKLHGIAADLSHTIADRGNGIAYDGYLEISAIDLENVTCTDDEKREIADLLKQGVIIRGAEI